ncbi:hypothetical protein K2173_017602 [Erythroxylum novogranatense]|uniref:SAGA-associated factor 11 n=1 Tax=Erythroxylum novogranatense TaxID=1862640 RepID=A0AAV8TLB4_9ROSI|nr:hypothetical protein K2173_017602 [Erythroxylum novogranatense]
MVCSLGGGKMAVMVRLLAGGSLSQTLADDVSQPKLAIQFINREFREADDPNFLNEEDMHVFGLRPMTDPLDLVCCNACKKPMKASQYAVHAELCRSLISTGEMFLQPSGGIGHRKPPRKDRKKSLSSCSNQATPAGEQEWSESLDADDTAALESHFDRRSVLPAPFTIDTKRNFACVDVTSRMDSKVLSPENTNPSACVMRPATKRSKLDFVFSFSALNRLLPQPDYPEISSRLANTESTQGFYPCREFQRQSTSGSDLHSGAIGVTEICQQAYEPYQMRKDFPAPIATKVYYSQRNNRLQSAIANLYHAVSADGSSVGIVSPEVSNGVIMGSKCQRFASSEQSEDLFNEKRRLPFISKPDQDFKQDSNVGMEKSGGCIPSANFSSHLSMDNIQRPQTAPVGLLQSKYLSNRPYSLAGNSGKSLGNMQQSNGSVPVL